MIGVLLYLIGLGIAGLLLAISTAGLAGLFEEDDEDND